MKLIEKIFYDLSLPIEYASEVFAAARDRTKHLKIPKACGGDRKIIQPSKKIKPIQYWLMKYIFNVMPVSSAAIAYQKGLSVLDNARRHQENRYFLKLDFSNFFWSIKYDDLKPLLHAWYKKKNPPWCLDRDAELLIRACCFYKNDELPIGYPSSPSISNVVMYQFDSAVHSLLAKNKDEWGRVVYTRYADDLIFSCNQKNSCKEILLAASDIIKNWESPKLKLNARKTKLTSSSGGSACVTGIKVCYDGHLTLHKKYKDKVRLLLSLYRKRELREADCTKLIGHLSYISFADPAFYTTLQRKFFAEIKSLSN